MHVYLLKNKSHICNIVFSSNMMIVFLWHHKKDEINPHLLLKTTLKKTYLLSKLT